MQKRGKTTWSSEEIPGCEQNTTASTPVHIATSLSLLTWSVGSESICFNESEGLSAWSWILSVHALLCRIRYLGSNEKLVFHVVEC